MPHRRASLLQGTLDLLILKALVAGELRGLGCVTSYRTDHERHVRGAAGLAVPRPPPPRGGRLAGVDLGSVVPFLVLALTLAASYVPARRAARVDPLRALGCE